MIETFFDVWCQNEIESKPDAVAQYCCPAALATGSVWVPVVSLALCAVPFHAVVPVRMLSWSLNSFLQNAWDRCSLVYLCMAEYLNLFVLTAQSSKTSLQNMLVSEA